MPTLPPQLCVLCTLLMLNLAPNNGAFLADQYSIGEKDEQLGQDALSAELPEVSKGCFQASAGE